MIRRRAQTPTVPPAWRRYLEHGDYRSDPADLDVFVLAGQVLRAWLDGLRAAWEHYGASILSDWPNDEPAPPFAVDVLENATEGDVFGVLAILNERRAPSAESAADEEARRRASHVQNQQ